jgi:enoyl-CoA hydratase/carnithine racemase
VRYTTDLAKEVAANAPQGVMHAKQSLNALLGRAERAQDAQATREPSATSMGKDYFEGVSAFLEKRKPKFTGE